MTDWVMVPREPTQEMLDAGDSAFEGGYVREMWSAMIEAAPQPPRPVKGDPMLDAVLDTPNPQFDAWVKSLPPAYWARYDLSACRIGFEAGAAPQQQADPGHSCSYYCTRPECIRAQRDELRDRMEAQQQAEPDSLLRYLQDVLAEGTPTEQVVARTCLSLYTSPRITSAQIEQIKRLVNRFETSVRMTQPNFHGSKHFVGPDHIEDHMRRAYNELRVCRDALYAALDAMMKGTP